MKKGHQMEKTQTEKGKDKGSYTHIRTLEDNQLCVSRMNDFSLDTINVFLFRWELDICSILQDKDTFLHLSSLHISRKNMIYECVKFRLLVMNVD